MLFTKYFHTSWNMLGMSILPSVVWFGLVTCLVLAYELWAEINCGTSWPSIELSSGKEMGRIRDKPAYSLDPWVMTLSRAPWWSWGASCFKPLRSGAIFLNHRIAQPTWLIYLWSHLVLIISMGLRKGWPPWVVCGKEPVMWNQRDLQA